MEGGRGRGSRMGNARKIGMSRGATRDRIWAVGVVVGVREGECAKQRVWRLRSGKSGESDAPAVRVSDPLGAS